MKQKTEDCFKLLAMPVGSVERRDFYNQIVQTHSETAVLRKIEELVRRGKAQHSGNLSTGTLTEAGRVFFEAYNTSANVK